VLAFARLMEAKLEKNRHKGNREGWIKDSPRALFDRLRDEVEELGQEIDADCPASTTGGEAADVGNFAMMIADVAGALKVPAAPSEPTPARERCRKEWDAGSFIYVCQLEKGHTGKHAETTRWDDSPGYRQATREVKSESVDRWGPDICARCGREWDTHLAGKAMNCPFVSFPETMPLGPTPSEPTPPLCPGCVKKAAAPTPGDWRGSVVVHAPWCRTAPEKTKTPCPKVCAKCGFNFGRLMTGKEIPCRYCDGRLCEKCCDAAKAEKTKAPEPRLTPIPGLEHEESGFYELTVPAETKAPDAEPRCEHPVNMRYREDGKEWCWTCSGEVRAPSDKGGGR
jgi:DNA-directed RNA polymerase subunit RPC12/RpoP/NTP pyrophosphatase (non-canonical NTP hydrolase)